MECEDVIKRNENKEYWWSWFHCHGSKWLFFQRKKRLLQIHIMPKKARHTFSFLAMMLVIIKLRKINDSSLKASGIEENKYNIFLPLTHHTSHCFLNDEKLQIR